MNIGVGRARIGHWHVRWDKAESFQARGDEAPVLPKPRHVPSKGFLTDHPVKRLMPKSAFLRKLERQQTPDRRNVTNFPSKGRFMGEA